MSPGKEKGGGREGGRMSLHVTYAHTSREKLHDEVEIDDVLKGVVHLDDPEVIRCFHKNISLSPRMCYLGAYIIRKKHTHHTSHERGRESM